MTDDTSFEPRRAPRSASGWLAFGPFEFDATSGLLYRGQREILLPMRVGKVLEIFLLRPGEVLSKDELLGEVWKDAFVGEDSLTQAISMLRSALGDDPRDPTYLQTIPKRGYRFIAEVRTGPIATKPIAANEQPAEPVEASPTPTEATMGVGSNLGHYEIVSELGAGAMGVVYRARDTVLEREVALKVLPEDFISDPGRVARFEREAKLLAAVSHPNIAAIHSLEEEGGTKFPVMELVEGETLEERLRSGPIKVDEALEFARQIASALEAAHERGIVHRDLKPANTKLTPAGQVKVLDFGLAKALEVKIFGEGVSESPTQSMTIMGSRRGSIVGTAAYMSPEQARGQEAGKQADIWAFGCVLFEMLTGKRAFAGDTVSDTIAGVLERAPDWAALPADTPQAAQRALRRCLCKDLRDRFHDIADARIDIEEALSEPERELLGMVPVTPGLSRWQRVVPWGVVGLAVGAILTSLVFWGLARPTVPAGKTVQSILPVESGRLWGGHPLEGRDWALGRPSRTAMVLSPDGAHLVYSATDGDQAQLHLRALSQDRSEPISGTEGGCCPFFSPDGESVGFFAAGDEGWSLKKVSLAGGEVWTIAEGVQVPFGATWGDHDSVVFAAGGSGGLFRVPASGGTPEQLTEVDRENGESDHRLPHFLPGGDALLYTVIRGSGRWDAAQIVAYSLRTGEPKTLIEAGADPRYVSMGSTGYLVFAREGTLIGVPFDPARLEVAGDEVRVREDVMQARFSGNSGVSSGAAQFSFSARGDLVYVPGGVYPVTDSPLVWADREGTPEVIDTGPGERVYPRISPAGRYVAYVTQHRGEVDLWVTDTQRGTHRRLVSRAGPPAWSPDGRRIAYSSRADGDAANLYVVASNLDPPEPRPLTQSERSQRVGSWTEDGLIFLEGGDVWFLPMEGEHAGEPRPVFESPFAEQHPAVSPSGRWLAYSSNENDRREVFVRPFPGPGAATVVSDGEAYAPAWSRDGRELYYRDSLRRMVVVEVNDTAGEDLTPGIPHLLFEEQYAQLDPIRSYDVGFDGRFVMNSEAQFTPRPVTQINLVLNWFEELKRLMSVER